MIVDTDSSINTYQPKFKIYGKGPHTLVLLHYFGGSYKSWKRTINKLSKSNYKVLALTLPGFDGEEPMSHHSFYDFAKFVNKVLKINEITNYTLCGHSMGAKIACYAAQINPDNRPTKLILVAPTPLSKGPSKGKLFNWQAENLLQNEAKSIIKSMARKKIKLRLLEQAVESTLLTNGATWNWWREKGLAENISNRIKGLSMPTYVVCSQKDPMVPMDAVNNTILPFLPRPKIISFGRSGHLLPLEAPRKLARTLDRILKRR